MLDHFDALGMLAISELHYLRMEAMDIFERCLTEGKPDSLIAFVEKQILHDPPRIELLQELCDDLHQRLLSLREYHFDVRDRVIRSLRSDFQVDLSQYPPVGSLQHYHLLSADQLIQFVVHQNTRILPEDLHLLRKVFEASLDMARQLHHDVTMTEELFLFVMEWSEGLSVVELRSAWLNEWEQNLVTVVH
jgi:hypothetical protein